MPHTRRFCVAILAACLLAGNGAAGLTLYGTSTDQPGTLFTIDTSTGAATKVTDITGAIGLFRHGMAFLDGTAYVSDIFVSPQQTAEFGTVDIVTGAFTPLPTNPVFHSVNNVGMAPDVDKHQIYFINNEDLPFLGILKPDGTVSPIGNTPSFYGDIAFDNVNDVLYAVNPFGAQPTLVTLDTQTAAQTVIGPLGISIGVDYGMEYDETTGTLYVNNGVTGNLYTLNKATGAATLVGPNFPGSRGGPIIDAIAFDRPTTFIPVPPAVWTGAVTLAGLAAAGAVRRGRIA